MKEKKEPKMTFINFDMNTVMKALCDVLGAQSGGEYEYTYTLELKEEYKNEGQTKTA